MDNLPTKDNDFFFSAFFLKRSHYSVQFLKTTQSLRRKTGHSNLENDRAVHGTIGENLTGKEQQSKGCDFLSS